MEQVQVHTSTSRGISVCVLIGRQHALCPGPGLLIEYLFRILYLDQTQNLGRHPVCLDSSYCVRARDASDYAGLLS